MRIRRRRRADLARGRGRYPRALGLVAAALAIVLTAVPASADSPKLGQARGAVEAVDYEAAQRLLLEALHDGGNSPAAVGEIYRLSARAAIVLGQRDVAEQYYRRWLAIDPDAALPGDTAPKLREPFVAAQAYIAAHGHLLARAQRAPSGEIDVELVSDPLAMAHSAIVLDPSTGSPSPRSPVSPARSPAPTGPPASPSPTAGSSAAGSSAAGSSAAGSSAAGSPAAGSPAAPAPSQLPSASPVPVVFGADRRARLAPGSRAAILDESRNRLLEFDVTAPASPVPEAPAAAVPSMAAPVPDVAPWTQRWSTWAIPTGAFGLVTVGFGIAAIASYGRAAQIADTSGQYFLSDAEDNVRRGRTFVWITAGAGAVTFACAIPTAIYFLRQRDRARTAVVPTTGDHQAGIAVIGSF